MPHRNAMSGEDSAFSRAPLSQRLKETFLRTWDLGFTSFGGPPVHFHIFYSRFVEKYKWIDDQTYQELFAVCQSLPGPASTKLGYCITLTYAGILPALLSFSLWCLPGAIGMYAAAMVVSHISDTLPAPIYGLLSGLNSATVGIITVAAVKLSEKSITDVVTRVVVITSATAGSCYHALWYYPALMVAGGAMTLGSDVWMGWRGKGAGSGVLDEQTRVNEESERPSYGATDVVVDFDEQSVPEIIERPNSVPPSLVTRPLPLPVSYSTNGNGVREEDSISLPRAPHRKNVFKNRSSWNGYFLVGVFLASLVTVLLVRALWRTPSIEFKLFSNLYLAGTIIFGGGPVVIPLLREYVVVEGWVSARDFFIGLAMIQAFPGPNFNFAIFLAALTASSANASPLVMALIGYVGMFSPGMVLATGLSALWQHLRRYRNVISFLRGINAAAVGLIWTAVYRLWEVGYMTQEHSDGISLGAQPWWVVIAALAFSSNRWFHVPPAVSIIVGGILGLVYTIISPN